MTKLNLHIDPPSKRYIVTKPVPGGWAWWCVADTQDPSMVNAEVACVRKDVPGVRKLIYDLCDRLNDVKPAKTLGHL